MKGFKHVDLHTFRRKFALFQRCIEGGTRSEVSRGAISAPISITCEIWPKLKSNYHLGWPTSPPRWPTRRGFKFYIHVPREFPERRRKSWNGVTGFKFRVEKQFDRLRDRALIQCGKCQLKVVWLSNVCPARKKTPRCNELGPNFR